MNDDKYITPDEYKIYLRDSGCQDSEETVDAFVSLEPLLFLFGENCQRYYLKSRPKVKRPDF